MLEINQITGQIVDAAYHVHTRIGPGLLESVYEQVLARTLERRGLRVERQKPISFEFDGMQFEEAFRADLLVEDRVLIELKSVEKLAPVHGKQVLTYLRLLDLPVGILINFGAASLNDGLQRIMNSHSQSGQPLDRRARQPSVPHRASQESHTESTESAEERRRFELR